MFRTRRNSSPYKRRSYRPQIERLEVRENPAVASPGYDVITYFSYTAGSANGPTDIAFGRGGLFTDDLYFTDNESRRLYRLNDANNDHDAVDAGEGTLMFQFPNGSVDRPQNLIFGNGVGAWGDDLYLVDDGPNLLFRVSDNTGSFVISTFANFNIFGIPTPTAAAYSPDGQFLLVNDTQNFTNFGGGSDGRIYKVSSAGAVTLWATGGNLPNGLWDNSQAAVTTDGWLTVGQNQIGGTGGPAQIVQFRDNNADGDALDTGEGRVLVDTNVPLINKKAFTLDSHDVLFISGGNKVYRLEDLNHDGNYYNTPANAFDAGEATIVLDSIAGAIQCLKFGPDGALYVGVRETGTKGVVYRLGANAAPTANAGGPYFVSEGGSIFLNGAGSSDPDGTIASYEWDFNYVAPNFDVNATGAAPAFSATGLDGLSSRTIALRVTDNSGASSVATTTLSVVNVLPTGSAHNAMVTVNEGQGAGNTGTYSDPADPVSLSASVGSVIDASGGTWSWSFTTGDGPDDSQTITIYGDDGDGAGPVAIASFNLVVSNVTPTGSADNATVTVNEGDAAGNTGTFSDPADPVGLSASVGNVIDAGGGAWSWSWTTGDGPDDGQTVTIYGDDGDGAGPVAIASFDLVVDNVAPTGSADNATVTVNEGDAAGNTGTFSDPADPVSLSASVGNVIDAGGGAWSWSWTTGDGPDDSQTVTIYGDDGAGLVAIASFDLVVNNVEPTGSADNATLTVNEGDAAGNTGTFGDAADPVSLSASIGSVIDAGGGSWSWSWTTGDGPDDGQTVTIYGDDGDGAGPVAIASFNLNVNNVAPSGAADQATVSVTAGATAANTGTFSDHADSVNLSASVGTVHDAGGGAWSWSWTTSPGSSQTVTIYGDDGAGQVAIASFDLIVNNVQPILLQIGPSQINLNGNGVFPIVLQSTPSFLVTNLDVATLRLSGAAAAQSSFSDVDNDGDLDLTLHFRRQDFVDEYAAALLDDLADGTLDDNHQEVALTLTGKTTNGADILAAAVVDMFMTGKKLQELLDSLGY